MNKYSSKAVKTAATVGMSLAMVLGNVAPVLADTYTDGICKGIDVDNNKADCGANVYLEIVGALDGDKFSTVTLDSDIKVANKAGKNVNVLVAIKDYEAELNAFVASDEPGYQEKAEINNWLKVVNAIEDYAGEGSLAAKEVKDGNLAGLIKNVNGEVDADEDWSVINDDNYDDAKDAFKELKDFRSDYGKYLGIDSEGEYVNDLAGAVQDTYVTLNDNINEYLGTTADSDLSDFVLAFDAILQNDLEEKPTTLTDKVSKDDDAKTIKEIIGSEDDELGKISLNNKSQIKARMNMIKDHDNYDRFEGEDAVIAILDAYQELLDNIGANADVLKSDEYEAYNKTKVSNSFKDVNGSSKVTVKNFVNDFVDGTASDKADSLAEVLNSEQWNILKAVKEEVMDAIYTMETRQVGNYYVDKSDYVSTATSSQRNTFENAFPEYLYTLVDKEEGLFGYDVVAAHMEDVAAALEAVTTDIAKITPANIKATDKEALETAEDAIFELIDGKYSKNLTSDEKKTVRSADAKITNLREAFDNLGVTSVAGWYDMGNGNWGYNNEDGTPAAYKWVASGSNWYFVRDGKMVRSSWLATDGGRWYYLDSEGKMVTNQSVDGCWINSYGVYMSPSYNG